jgi:two-component system, NarL family, response regulator DevR
VMGAVGTTAEALALVPAVLPQVVILDVRLADCDDSTAVIPDILTLSPNSKVLVLSAWGDDWSVSRAVEAGCHGYLLKEQGLDDLIDGIRSVARGEATFAPAVLSRVLKLLRPGTVSAEALTVRENDRRRPVRQRQHGAQSRQQHHPQAERALAAGGRQLCAAQGPHPRRLTLRPPAWRGCSPREAVR